jgi:hypothetical protein
MTTLTHFRSSRDDRLTEVSAECLRSAPFHRPITDLPSLPRHYVINLWCGFHIECTVEHGSDARMEKSWLAAFTLARAWAIIAGGQFRYPRMPTARILS